MIARFLGDHQSWLKVEGLLALCSLVWGVVIIWPTDTFGSGPAYIWFVGPEWAWGLLFTLFGALRLWAAVKRLHYLRVGTSLFGVVCWGVVAWLFLLGNPASASAAVFVCFSVASLGSYLSARGCHLSRGIYCNGIVETQLKSVIARVEEMTPDDFDGV